MSTLPQKNILQYGGLALPVAFAGMPLYVLAPDFYATQYGVSLASLGIILLFLRALDSLQDPLIGLLSDRYARLTGKIMSIAAIVLVLSVLALFNPVEAMVNEWFAVFMLLAVTAYSVLSVNLNTLGGLWSKDAYERTRITTTREALALCGLVIAITLPSLLKEQMSATAAFSIMAGVLAVLMLLTLPLFMRWLGAHYSIVTARPRAKWSFVSALKSLKPRTRSFLAVYGISMLASSIPAILVIFFIRDRLAAESYTGLFLLLYFLSGALTMPVWKKLSKHYGKYTAWMLSMLLAVGCFVWAYFLGAGDVWQYAVICIASGSALGADMALPPSILADHVDDSESENHAAMQFSLLTLLAKLSLALGSAIVLPLLDASGFVAAAENSEAALHSLSLAYALIPCLIKLAAAGLLYILFIRKTKESPHENILDHRSTNGRSYHA